MAFAMGNAAAVSQARQGPDLQEIVTEKLGFLTLAGDAKLRLLPTPWPSDKLPPPTASLLAVSSNKGLVAAAGPDQLVLATTDTVRQAFKADAPAGSNVKAFTPQLTIKVPRVNQVAFSSDGEFLVISAEQGGGLAVYETQSLLQGKQEPAFEMATNNIGIRALAPNPAAELAHGLAIVLNQGQLMLADLKARQFQEGPNGPVLREGVSCVAWSPKGKQLVAGLGDGMALQMDIQNVKATIPRPPGIEAGLFVSRMLWLTNDEFIVVHTPVSPGDDDMAPPSTFHFIARDKGTQNYTFRKLNDPCGPFGLKRAPQSHFFARLRQFPPDLADLLIVASSSSSDVGLFSRATQPLSSEPPKVANEFTTTSLQEDSRRAMLPPSDMSETSPIGMALDLSSKDLVPRPIPGDEMDQSPTPLPAMMILNNEGMLLAWWVVYNDALRQGVPFGELEAVKGSQPAASLSTPQQQQNSLGSFAKPQPAFGSPAFGSGGAAPAFGGAASLGMNRSPWGAASNMGKPQQPAFGQSAFGQPAFGQAGGGAFASAGKSPWGTPASSAETAGSKPPPFGGNASAASPFSSFAANKGSAASPFGSLGADKKGQSPFASVPSATGASFGMKTEPSFGSTVTIDSSTGGSTLGSKSSFGGSSEQFGAPAPQNNTLFGTKPAAATPQETEMGDADESMGDEPAKAPETAKSEDGLAGFKLQSSFKPGNQEDSKDGTVEAPQRDRPESASLFGNAFSNALADTQKPAERPEPVAPETPIKKEPGSEEPGLQNVSTTPATPATGPSNEGAPEARTATEPSGLPSIPESSQRTPAGSPLAGSSPEEIAVPDSPGLTDDEQDKVVVDDAPLPPDPSTIKVDKSFYTQRPDQLAPPKQPADLFETPPAAAKASEALSAQQISRAAAVPSTTPAGFPKGDLFPAPVAKTQESPRSPSPVRSASTPAGRGAPFASQGSIHPPVTFQQSASQPRPAWAPSKQPAQQPQPEDQSEPQPDHYLSPADLQDAEADRVRAILEQEIKPTPYLRDFQAYQDYARKSASLARESTSVNDATGTARLGRQIETMYRDMNDMVDTLGMNARYFEAWLLWNEGGSVQSDLGVRALEDLKSFHENVGTDDEEKWSLVELVDIDVLVAVMLKQLERHRIQPNDKTTTLRYLAELARELRGLRKRTVDVRKWLHKQNSPALRQKQLDEDLPPDVAAKQHELNTKVAEFKKVLVQAEEAATILKAKIARSGKAGQAPTLEAVTRTVEKVNEIARERSEDVDVLEGRMRKLGLLRDDVDLAASMRSLALEGSRSSPLRGGPSRGSREGTPSAFATPKTPAAAMRRSRMGGGYGLSSSVESTPGNWRGSANGSRSLVKVEEQDAGMNVAVLVARKKKRALVRDEMIKALVHRAEVAQQQQELSRGRGDSQSNGLVF